MGYKRGISGIAEFKTEIRKEGRKKERNERPTSNIEWKTKNNDKSIKNRSQKKN
jgi:hypothetical protein